ncbi:intraflagellar transport protein 80 homolog [Papilio machaon]|uniref:intraflagellar transport protein 80 homolog n=1 Tax=Papilio machaon TaxID=76193 RepID=UPI001E665641|nr:intraflagellar transport protein 80 homolog [Papilio machaon]
MRLKVSPIKKPKHDGAVICVGWNNTEDVFSCGDDHKLLKWNLATNECMSVATFPDDLYPTGLHLFSKINNSGKKSQTDFILIASTDGRFHIVNYNGRIEKSINAHQGACLVALWSPNADGILTAGEDGCVKIWSCNGLLRSTVVESDVSCYMAAWSPDSNSILYTKKHHLVIHPLQAKSKVTKWWAHESVILSVGWNASNNLIVSGDEDGYIKVWDTFQQLIFSTKEFVHPCTAISWSPHGDLFVAGSFNKLSLHSDDGWPNSSLDLDVGSVYCVAWSPDGTQLAAACADGHVIFAHIIDRTYNWKNFTCTQIGRKVIAIKDITTDESDQLDYPDSVVQIALGFDHLAVATIKQCFIHKLTSWNTPVTFDLKDGAVSVILLASRCMCIVERGRISVYSYTGRLLASPQISSHSELRGRASISLGPDTLASIDYANPTLIQVFDLPTATYSISRGAGDNNVTRIKHHTVVCSIALSQTGPINERQIALLDKRRDLLVATVKDSKQKLSVLSRAVLSVMWSTESELLVGLKKESIVSWAYQKNNTRPELTTTVISIPSSNMGYNPTIQCVENGVAIIYRGKGSTVMHISLGVIHVEMVLKYIASNMWSEALQLCRTLKDTKLWGCLAEMALEKNQLDIAEEAFEEVHQYAEVFRIQHLKNIRNSSGAGNA